MEDFKKQLNRKSKLENLLDQKFQKLDDYIWEIFSKYIKDFKINFNIPEDWEEEGDGIYFTGEDGCRGCYNRMSLKIPYEFFENYEKEKSKKVEVLEREEKENTKRLIENKRREIE